MSGGSFRSPPGLSPYVVFGPEANRKVLVTERNKVLWRNTDPVTDLLRRAGAGRGWRRNTTAIAN
jgi:hypothetical protein